MKTSQNFWKTFACALPLLLIVYAPALHGDFLIDDIQYIVENPLVAEASTPWHFWTNLQQVDFWPVFYTAVWSMWKLFGLTTWPYHVLNVVLHAANVALLGEIFAAYGLKRLRVWALLVFALHPLAAQSVAWIFQLKTLLSTFLAFASLRFYQRNSYAGSLVAFVLAALTKSSVVLFPVAFFLHDLWQGRSLRLRRYLPFWVCSALATFTTLYVNAQTFEKNALWNPSLVERVLTAFRNLNFYALKGLVPAPLAFAYPWQSAAPERWISWIPFVVTLFVAGGLAERAFRAKRREALAAFCLFVFYAANLAPGLGFIATPYMRFSLVADHYAYLSLGALVWAVALLWERYAPTSNVVWGVPLAFAFLTFWQVPIYKDEVRLWTYAARMNPGSVWTRFNLGVSLAKRQQYAASVPQLERAARGPSDAPEYLIASLRQSALYTLARSLSESGRNPEAAAALERLLEINPSFVNADYNLAMLYHQKLGQLDRAEALYLRSLQTDLPNSGDPTRHLRTLVNLCHVSIAKKDRVRALERCEKAARLYPTEPDPRVNLAQVYFEAKRWREALALYEGLVTRVDLGEELLTRMGNLYAKTGNYVKAKETYARVLELNSSNVEALKYFSAKR